MEANRKTYTVDDYKKDFVNVWYRFEYITEYIAEFIRNKRDVIDYSLGAPMFIKLGVENSTDDVKALLLRMFLKNNTNYNYLIVDKRVTKTKKKLMLQMEQRDNVILPVFKLFEYSKNQKEWVAVDEFDQTEINGDYIHKVPLVLSYLFKYER